MILSVELIREACEATAEPYLRGLIESNAGYMSGCLNGDRVDYFGLMLLAGANDVSPVSRLPFSFLLSPQPPTASSLPGNSNGPCFATIHKYLLEYRNPSGPWRSALSPGSFFNSLSLSLFLTPLPFFPSETLP
jgi:hypothetical protein